MSLLPSAVAIANQAMLAAEMATLYGMLTSREGKAERLRMLRVQVVMNEFWQIGNVRSL